MNFRFPPTAMPDMAPQLRREVRAFLEEAKAEGLWEPSKKWWMEFNRPFSQALGARGWIGMTWPRRYGGQERPALERYVVTEELLANGAPIRCHWAADRQIGPLILEFGTDWQKETLLPAFASGGVSIAVGLSEPDSGSDLSAIRSRAVRSEGGWLVDGRKIWITNAHNSRYMTLFVRTSSDTANRRDGITRFLVDMQSSGISVLPIKHMAGEADLNEVVFDQVFVPDRMVIGDIDKAWSQMGSELANERSSPDRWTASLGLYRQMVDHVGPKPGRAEAEAIGRIAAHLWTLKGMSLSIAGMNERGQNTVVEGSVVKDLGTHLDQEIPDMVRRLVDEEARADLPPDHTLLRDLHYGLLFSPALTIRGGTREILRNGIARALGIR